MGSRRWVALAIAGMAAGGWGGTAWGDVRSFAADGGSLAISGPCARHVTVQVDPALRERIAVDATAEHPEEIAQLAVDGRDGAARVELAPDRRQCWRPDPSGSFRPTLVLTVRIPAGFPVAISSSGTEDYTLGAVGPLTLSASGATTLVADSVAGDARIELSGHGDVGIGELDAALLSADISGTGSVRVKGGRINRATLSLSGNGEMRIDPTVGDATVDVSGVGDVVLGGVSGRLTRSVSGMATIMVAGQRVRNGGGDEN
ncbi:MAG: DUF2807 domain-containing protein [Gluconacetobacter diazotrophicus]|nr:DUF2807 domain-containing protein [Gluconacetobacter diazotrophicus]